MVQQEMRRACFSLFLTMLVYREKVTCLQTKSQFVPEQGYFVGTLIWNHPAYKYVENKFCLHTSSQSVCLLVLYCYSLNIKCPLQALVCTLESQLNCQFDRFRICGGGMQPKQVGHKKQVLQGFLPLACLCFPLLVSWQP